MASKKTEKVVEEKVTPVESITCPSCGAVYPVDRETCPACASLKP